MKSNLSIALFLTASISFAQKSETHYKGELDFGNGIILSTFFDAALDKNKFTITSPKDADVRIFGGKAKLGRALGKSPKKGIIMTIKGEQKNDSLFGETTIPMFGKLNFKGIVQNETLSGELINDKKTKIGSLRSIKSAENKIDYRYLHPMMVKTVYDNIYSKDVMKTDQWKKFDKNLEELCHTAQDDIEMYFGFSMLTPQLPFTHLSFIISESEPDSEKAASKSTSVIFEEKNSNTAYLQIKNFSVSTEELAAIMPKIVENPNYENLIVDLRDNGGGGIDAAFEFVKHIVTADMEVGYFVTNKLQYSGYQPDLFKTLPELQPKSTEDFTNELKASPGVKLIFKKPNNAVFKGNLYILTNGRTGSTCEPMVYAFKNTKKATIIGEKTYGGMLAACPFEVSGKYMLFLPVADFYTYDGVRLDKVGVSPDIEVDSKDALNKTLEIINKGKI